MPQTAQSFLEEGQQSAEDFLDEAQSAESFLKAPDARVAQMAAATRHTVGVVGRAIAATDFAIKNIPDQPEEGSYEQQLSDNPLPAEEAIANEPDSIAVRRLTAQKQIQEGLQESAISTRRANLATFGHGVASGANVFGTLTWIGRILGGFTEDVMQGRVLPTGQRAAPDLRATGSAFTGTPDEHPPPQARLTPVQQGIAEGVKGLPPIIAAGMLVSAGVTPSVAFAVTMGGTALEETGDPVQAAQSAAIGAVLPGVGNAAKQLGARVMAGAVNNGLVSAENVVAQKAVEAGAELLGIVAFNEAMHLPGYAEMTPEERKVALQKSLASNIAFLPMIVPTVFGKGRTATQERLSKVAPLTAEAVANVEPVYGDTLDMAKREQPPSATVRRLLEEGVTRPDAEALVAGTKTPQQVVEGAYGKNVVPAWNADVSQVYGGHGEAWATGFNQSVERLAAIVANEPYIPKPLTPLTTEAVAKVVPKEPVPPPTHTPAAATEVTVSKPPPLPVLVEATRQGNSIRLEFDASKERITAEDVKRAFEGPDRSVEVIAFAPNEFSTAQGRVNFDVIVGTPEGPYSTELAIKAYREAFGSDAPFRGKSEIEKALPFEERFTRSLKHSMEQEMGTNPPAKPEGELTLTTVPEHLRPSKATQDILDSQPAATPPEGGLKTAAKPAPEGGAIFGAGGRRTPAVAPVGATPRGDKNWLRIPSSLKRIGRGLFTEGARAVLGRTRNQVGQELSRATRRHVDVEQELFGQHEAILRGAVRAIPKQRLDPAFTEASQYVREVENGRPAPPVSPEARSLLDAWFEVGRSTGDIARANDVQVFDPALGRHRPMGNVQNYVPRMFTAEVEAVLRDPKVDPVLFNRLADAIATQRGITLDAAANELRGVAGRFQSNDYMANLELARGAQMPELFYEYNLRNLAARYLPSFSERMAQIIAYGQRLGPRDAPQRQNLWDVARRESEDSYTQEWLNTAEDQATGFKPKSELEKNARRLQALSSATLLSDPTTTVVRNLLSGLAATTEAYGVGRSVRQLRNSMRMAARLGAREIGAIRDDLASFLNSDLLGDSALDNAIRGTSEFTLRVSGFTGSENFVRTHNALVASGFARDAAAALTANPRSRLSREALAQFQRWNIDPEAIIREGGNWRTGPETRSYIRTAVREMQGGYRFDQVPLWANSTAGRFFYQYGRWGVQRAQNIFQNIVRPAIGEEVTFRGKTMRHQNLLPLIRAGALTIALGETFGAIAFGLFGKDRRDSSLSEISEAWSEDELKAVGLLGERMVNDIIMAGTLGIIGQPIDFAKSAKDQSRFKNPLDPPSAAGVKAIVELAQRALDQDGTLTKRDLLDAASKIVRGPKNVAGAIHHWTSESLYEGQNDQRTLRMAAMRWAKETKQDVPIRSVTEIRKSPTAPAYEAVNDALLSGNAESAKKAAEEFIDKQPDKAKARAAMAASVRARQPFRAGNMTSEEHRNEFMKWAEKNLSEGDMKQIQRVQERYRKTAADAGLL